jgi:hypothetical protein
MFGRDDHIALHAIATLFGNNQVIADYEVTFHYYIELKLVNLLLLPTSNE